MNTRLPTVLLAPMAGITDAAMRSISIRFGAPLCTTEMISAKGLIYKNLNTEELLRRAANEERFVVQLFGDAPGVLAEAGRILEDKCAEALFAIDLNMGCPAPKIFRNGEGAALMNSPDKAAEMVRAVRSAVHVPVSAKIRAGVDAAHRNAPELARLLEEAGADWITVHARTREQYYSGHADWSIIRRVKEVVSVPVIGNGDIDGADAAEKMRRETGCDAVMIGRAAIGNPFLFAEFALAEHGTQLRAMASDSDRLDVLMEHLRLAVEFKGPVRGVREMRAQIPKYLKGMRGACEMRARLLRLDTPESVCDVLCRYKEELETGERSFRGALAHENSLS